MPRFIFIPFRTSFAALLTIFSLTWSLPDPETFPSLKMTFPFKRSLSLMSRLISEWSLTVNFYINFSEKGEAGSSLQMRSTYTAGTWMHSGSNSPSSTIYSTSAITHFAAVAISALKFRSVFQNCRFPIRSARLAFTSAKSPKMDCSITYFLPLKTAVGLGAEAISATCLPFSSRTNFPYASVLYLMGNPPFSMMVSTPVAVKKAGMPAPPDLIFSARVPWGQIQSSSSPLKNCLSNSQFSPTQLEIMRFICLFLSSTARPQSVLPSLSPTPQLLDAIVSCLVPACLTALIRFMGTPHMPNPPTNKKDPSLMPQMASCGVLQTRAKACQRRINKEESIYPINKFLLSPPRTTTNIPQDRVPSSSALLQEEETLKTRIRGAAKEGSSCLLDLCISKRQSKNFWIAKSPKILIDQSHRVTGGLSVMFVGNGVFCIYFNRIRRVLLGMIYNMLLDAISQSTKVYSRDGQLCKWDVDTFEIKLRSSSWNMRSFLEIVLLNQIKDLTNFMVIPNQILLRGIFLRLGSQIHDYLWFLMMGEIKIIKKRISLL